MICWPEDYSGAWTLGDEVERSGIGLHSGNQAVVRLTPSDKPGFHIRFIDDPQPIRLAPDQVSDSQLCTTLDLGTVGESIEGLRETVASHLSGQEGDGQTQQALSQSLATFQAALEQQQAQFSENAASTREYNHQLADYLGSSLQALQENVSASQSHAQSAQMQSALTNIGNLFSSYQDRNRDLQESLASAQPTEVVVDVSKQMAEDSDALIQQILSQLKEAQQPQQQPENPPPQAEE